MTDGGKIANSKDWQSWCSENRHRPGWANGRALRTTKAIVFRAALRTFPTAVNAFPVDIGDEKPSRENYPLQAFRALMLTSLYAFRAERHLYDEAKRADEAFRWVFDSGNPLAPIAAALKAATLVRGGASPEESWRTISYAVDSGDYAAASSMTKAWHMAEFHADVQIATEDWEELAHPLVQDEGTLDEEWQLALRKLQHAQEDWSAVIDWFERVRDPLHPLLQPDLLREFAKLPETVWDGNTGGALAEINELWRTRMPPMSSVQRYSNKKEAIQGRQDELLERQAGDLKGRVEDIEESLSNASGGIQGLRLELQALRQQAAGTDKETRGLLKELRNQFTNEVDAANEAYREANRIKEPIDLWSQKQSEHQASANAAAKFFYGSLIGIAVFVLFGAFTVLLKGGVVLEALSGPSCDPVNSPDFCSVVSLQGGIILASIATLLTLALWYSRLKMKEFLSERHLALDARERRAFAEAYVGLLAEGDSSKEAKEQRVLVYASLFRPSTDGMVKDDGGLDPSIAAAISKVLSK